MSQRLGIAAAVLGDPTVVLFDEPINGLDPEGIQWIRGLLRRFAAEGRGPQQPSPPSRCGRCMRRA